MRNVKHALRLAGTAVATTAVAVGLTAGLAAAPASAAPAATAQPWAHLNIAATTSNVFTREVSITGVFPMEQADAQGYINNLGTRGGMLYVIMGDDPGGTWDDDAMWQEFRQGAVANNASGISLQATPDGLVFHRSVFVGRRSLNEDDGPLDYRDEIYMNAYFIDGDGGTRKVVTNVVNGIPTF